MDVTWKGGMKVKECRRNEESALGEEEDGEALGAPNKRNQRRYKDYTYLLIYQP